MAVSLPFATVAQKITAALYNALVNVLNVSTGALVIPTVSGTGTSITVDPTGLVNCTAATVVAVDTAFSTAFRKHKISIQSTTGSATATWIFRTSAPADDTNLKYDRTVIAGAAAAATSVTTPSAAGWPIIGSAGPVLVESEIELVGAPLAQPTTGFLRGGQHSNPAASGATNSLNEMFLTQQESTPFTGFKITFSVPWSGTIRVTGEY